MGAQWIEVAQSKKKAEIFSYDGLLRWLITAGQIDALLPDCPSNCH